MPSSAHRPRRRAALASALVLVLAAVGVLWSANRLSDPTSTASDRNDDASSRPASSDDASGADGQDPGSGWAPVVAAAGTGNQLTALTGTRDQVAVAALAHLVQRAPVVVTVDTAGGPAHDEAAVLARSLQAPLVQVVDGTQPAPTSTPGPTSTPTTDTSGPAQPTGDGATIVAGGDVATAAALLEQWQTSHVVAIGTPPETSARVLAVDVSVTPAPTDGGDAPSSTSLPSTSPSSTSAPSSSTDTAPVATESAVPEGLASAEVVVTRAPEVDAMLADAADAAEPPVPATDAPVLVVRGGDDGPRVRGDVATTMAVLDLEPAVWTGDDPRDDDGLVTRLRGQQAGWLLAVADQDLPTMANADWPSLLLAAAVAPQLPGGGLTLFPQRAFVAAYGNPRGPALGVLGERDAAGSIAYVQDLASDYEGLLGDARVQPAFEIIVTIASKTAEPTGDYSRREDLGLVTEWVDAATDAGLYVVLDLQPGRTDFLTQAKEVEELLVRPNVGLALDPEWRLTPSQFHLDQIGTVTTAEVNQVGEWLAALVRREQLPQKLLLIHNFRLSMLTDRQDLVAHPELATLIHVDGQGAQDDKDATYQSITSAGPDFVWWGWKNFYDEDVGLRTPTDTAAVRPQPNFVSYQ